MRDVLDTLGFIAPIAALVLPAAYCAGVALIR